MEAWNARHASLLLTSYRMRQHSRASIVHQNNMHLIWAFVAPTPFSSSNQRLVSSQLLSGSRARQQLEKHIEVSKPREDLLDAHQRDVYSGQASGQSDVALIF